jgi:transcriptional regulator with XRE-family HTH domain
MKNIRILINDLIDRHGNNFTECKGCYICAEVQVLQKRLEREPAERYKHILHKGQDMTKSDIAFLLENEVSRKDIQKALKMDSVRFSEMMRNFGLTKKQQGDEEMAKLTQEEYKDLKAKGLTDKQIAERKGMSQPNVSMLKKKWFEDTVKPDLAIVEVSESKDTREDKNSEYEALIAQLKGKLESKDSVIEEKDLLIGKLEVKIQDYENLQAACGDVEEEAARLHQQHVKDDATILNQKYQLGQYAKQVEELEEENAALKTLAKRYLAVV